jgi:hypothetical protein
MYIGSLILFFCLLIAILKWVQSRHKISYRLRPYGRITLTYRYIPVHVCTYEAIVSEKINGIFDFEDEALIPCDPRIFESN